MQITKNDDNSATLTCEHGTFVFTEDEFDDLIHAVPISTTHLYRLLIDTLVEGDDRKAQLRALIEAGGNADAALSAIQDEAVKYVPTED
ncbi:MAG: hypothetical protein OEY28_12245 [Nitrospira sp.]|nr:hypothetical protein [Nitrospira sp.]